jgi:hypothetical protein
MGELDNNADDGDEAVIVSDESDSDDREPEDNLDTDSSDTDGSGEDLRLTDQLNKMHADGLKLCLDVIDVMFANDTSQAATTRQCESTIALLIAAGGDQAIIDKYPKTCEEALYRTRKLMRKMESIHACVNDCILFTGVHARRRKCSRCGEARFKANNKQPRRVFFSLPLRDWVADYYRYRHTSCTQTYTTTAAEAASGELYTDVFSGRVFEEVVRPVAEDQGIPLRLIMTIGLSFDAVGMSRWPALSLTPILGANFLLPPWIRNKVDAMLLLGMMPRNEQNSQLFLRHIAKQFADLAPRSSRGMKVWNIHTQREEKAYAMCIGTIADTEGISKGNRQNQPGKSHACTDCVVGGIHLKAFGTTVFPGAGRYADDDGLREEYRDSLDNCPAIVSSWGDGKSPKGFTDEYVMSAMRAGDRCNRKNPGKAKGWQNHVRWTRGWHGTCVWTEFLWYWRPWMMTVKDPGHILLNTVRDLVGLWGGDNTMGKSSRGRELEIQRFEELVPERKRKKKKAKPGKSQFTLVHPRPPWTATKDELNFVKLTMRKSIRLPHAMGGGRMVDYFNDVLTMHDAVNFCSGLGKYILSFLPSIGDDQREASERLLESVITPWIIHGYFMHFMDLTMYFYDVFHVYYESTMYFYG